MLQPIPATETLYPEILIPLLHYKKIDEADLSEKCVCRTTINSDWKQVQENHLISEDVLYQEWSELFDYSTNLPGHFLLAHNYIELIGDNKKSFYSYWDWENEGRAPKYEIDYVENKSRSCFFLDFSKIHKQVKFPFSRPPKNQSDTLTAEIIHTPTFSNFWHFSIRWKDTNGEYIKASDSKWKAGIAGSMRALLLEYIQRDEPAIQSLHPNKYSKN